MTFHSPRVPEPIRCRRAPVAPRLASREPLRKPASCSIAATDSASAVVGGGATAPSAVAPSLASEVGAPVAEGGATAPSAVAPSRGAECGHTSLSAPSCGASSGDSAVA